MQEKDGRIRVSGTVRDVRPWLKSAKVAVVPLRIGGGTRLKIYESMAARLPVVSTTVGAEGLAVRDGENILLADQPDAFADACVKMMEDQCNAALISAAGLTLVKDHFSWEVATDQFERQLQAGGKASLNQ